MNIIAPIIERIWPISIHARVLSGQFAAPQGVRMVIDRAADILTFHPTGKVRAGYPILDSDILNLQLEVRRGKFHLLDKARGRYVKLNLREARLLRAAVIDWLELDGIDGQIAIIDDLAFIGAKA